MVGAARRVAPKSPTKTFPFKANHSRGLYSHFYMHISNSCRSLSAGVVLLLAAFNLSAQEPLLDRLMRESKSVRGAAKSPESKNDKGFEIDRQRSAAFKEALRDWIESRLPSSRSAFDSDLSHLQAKLRETLWRTGLMQPDGSDEYGHVSRMEISQPAEYPEALSVVVGVTVPCGFDDSFYLYDYSQGSRNRVLESNGSRQHDESISDIYYSTPDEMGSHLILTLRYGVQCGSSWNGLSYDLYRLGANSEAAVPIFSGEHGIWFGAEHPCQARLAPHELLMELRDRSIDAGIHNRTHVLRYEIKPDFVERVDPVALQPQDFVDEWLSRPWSEMESRSSAAGREKLQQWHDFLSGDFVSGDLSLVQSCAEKPDHWQISVDMHYASGKELPEPLTVYFLVRHLDTFRFEMTDASFSRQDGCPGESQPNLESPSLFGGSPKDMGAL
jgi:hypothetical protein